MEAIRPRGLRLIAGGRDADPRCRTSEREERIAEEAKDAHLDWLRRLPVGSTLAWPFRQARRALGEWLRRRRGR
jgi:hypothetical protein